MFPVQQIEMEKERSLPASILSFRCPRCREGRLFPSPTYSTRFLKTNSQCPCCGQDFVVEPGFFLGSTFFSRIIYAAILLAAAVFLYRFRMENSIAVIIASVLVIIFGLLPIVLRLSKSAWIHIFIRYEGRCDQIPKKG